MPRTPLDLGARIPEPFAKVFDQNALSASPATIVVLDSGGVILWLNPAWHRFAEQNHGSQIRERFGLGANYFDGISGPLREYFIEAFTHVLRSQRPFELDYECSSPERRVFMRLRVLPVRDAGVLLEHSPVSEGPFLDEQLRQPAPHYVNEHGFITQCSNCRKVRRADTLAWEWVPRWISTRMPNVSHGLCDICYGFYWRARLSR